MKWAVGWGLDSELRELIDTKKGNEGLLSIVFAC